MKKVLIVILAISGLFLFRIPEYKELNDLAIIEGIAVYYDGVNYTIYLKEIIPIKSEQGIEYKYKYYQTKDSNVYECYKKIISNTKKKLYLKRCKFLVTNISGSDEIINIFKIKPKNIYHEIKDVYEKLKQL